MTRIKKFLKNNYKRLIAYVFALLLVAGVFCQLFSFDEFLALLVSFNFVGGATMAYILGISIVILEVFALPFLLQVKLSFVARVVSMIFGWVVAVFWLVLPFYLLVTYPYVMNIGFLGTVIDIPLGWGAVMIGLALSLLALWSSWGLWPAQNKKSVSQKGL